ncbi:hypothetical protein H5410_044813 [Solanum commersonii]|uniref:Uncharacterized protein n=1 Tax=Solanum commersonii TaxID=4109 RepID=A0A9J5X802_SOLCO|nr:hypothetical protein H5410_044813 [Solanum commersonii]
MNTRLEMNSTVGSLSGRKEWRGMQKTSERVFPDNDVFSFKLVLNKESELLDWFSPKPGLIQILMCPSRQTVSTDS